MHPTGFGNYHQSEALKGALPQQQNSPQKAAFGLYAEQLSGSAFTRPRQSNLHSWLYRILPSVVGQDYQLYSSSINRPFMKEQPPVPMRWSPLTDLQKPCDFVEGWHHIAGNAVLNTYIFRCNQSMTNRYFSNNDGELLFVPYLGELAIHTEFGILSIKPGMIAVVPRGVKFKIELLSSQAAGYLCENAALPLTLPQLGPIGSNGLANPRHFLYPQAAYEEVDEEVVLLCKSQHVLWSTKSHQSPLNVVAWHGNYAPYCYDLTLFNTINTVSFDHPDPSIFTVLTSESHTPGVANLDLVIFPARWMVAEHTFRPPYFHRNIMSELMGLIYGQYDAKKEGFAPGGVSIHNCMTAHGPDAATYKRESTKSLNPEYYNNTLAFMFESCLPWQITDTAFEHDTRQQNYLNCWDGLQKEFKQT